MGDRANRDARELKLVETLKTARKRAHLSQAELAAKIGKRQQFVSKYESGERRLDFFDVLDVAEAVGLTLQSLFKQISDVGTST